MARAKVIHSQDGVTILFEGNKNKPEPTIGVIRFPGGNIEVSRTSDGSYFAHITVNDGNGDNFDDVGVVTMSRVGYTYGKGGIQSLENEEHVNHVAIKITKK